MIRFSLGNSYFPFVYFTFLLYFQKLSVVMVYPVFGLLLHIVNLAARSLIVYAEENISYQSYDFKKINLPAGHLPYFLHNNQDVVRSCSQDPHCPFRVCPTKPKPKGLNYYYYYFIYTYTLDIAAVEVNRILLLFWRMTRSFQIQWICHRKIHWIRPLS